jgi:hypothetical protein
MESIKATVRDGRIETDAPVDLPDGTQVLVVEAAEGEGGWDNSPEGIAQWLQWYDSLELRSL